MKQLLTAIFLFAFCLCGWAQITINVSGHVENTDGSPAEGVSITIGTDSSAIWPGYYNTVQTDASGFYSDTFDVPDNATQGAAFITMHDCNNDYQFETHYWNPGNTDLTADFVYCDLSDDCSVTVVQDTIAPGGGFSLYAAVSYNGSISYLWNTGDTTQSIDIFDSGEYCVTITDTEGCTASDCLFIDLTSNNCSVNIELNPSGALTAVADGTVAFTYAWSTGEATQSIMPTTTGNYCVTLTDADGCESSDCYYYNTQQDSMCYVSVYPVQNGTLLEAYATGTAPFAYLWNTQETTSYIAPAGSGTYCVTITDAVGCISSACYTIEDPNNFVIEGYVFLQDSNLLEQIYGMAYLYEIDSNDELNLVDSTQFGTTPVNATAWYSFGTVSEGDYIVLATLDPASPGYADHLPTYYGNVLFWSEASVIGVPYLGTSYFTIMLIEGNLPEGPGIIGGSVEDMGFTDDPERNDPLALATILLLDENDQPLSHTKMDEEGDFRFENLAWGTYKVYLEIPGYEQQHVVVTIGPDNPEVRDIEFEIESGTVTNTVELEAKNQLFVYPNPVQEMLNVRIEGASTSKAVLSITSITGKRLLNQGLNANDQTVQINTSKLLPGIYFLSLNQGEEVKTIRFVKK